MQKFNSAYFQCNYESTLNLYIETAWVNKNEGGKQRTTIAPLLEYNDKQFCAKRNNIYIMFMQNAWQHTYTYVNIRSYMLITYVYIRNNFVKYMYTWNIHNIIKTLNMHVCIISLFSFVISSKRILYFRHRVSYFNFNFCILRK